MKTTITNRRSIEAESGDIYRLEAKERTLHIQTTYGSVVINFNRPGLNVRVLAGPDSFLVPEGQRTDYSLAEKQLELRAFDQVTLGEMDADPTLKDQVHKWIVRKREAKAHADRQAGLRPGTVCSECGRTVKQAEFSRGEAAFCKAEVVSEEDYGKEAKG